MLKLSNFDYKLPERLIAQKPTVPRDSSKLMVIDRNSDEITDHQFSDLVDLLDDSYVIVRNNTKVIPARIFGNKETGGKVELLLLKRLGISNIGEQWDVMTKPGLKPGQKVLFEDSLLVAQVESISGYTRIISFNQNGEEFFESLDKIGHTPIPPYIKWNDDDEKRLRDIYQTIYAKHQGSAAAPTAGLHFTNQLDKKLVEKGIVIEEVTLHVGLGTFLPVKDEIITDHKMHSEKYVLGKDTAQRLNQLKKEGKKILSVGTTTTRLLESCVDKNGQLVAGEAETDIFIFPPYQYQFVDAIITNFHLPKSTLLMMISAFVSYPNVDVVFSTFKDSLIGEAYKKAISDNYRFYSFGDAMLIK